MFHFHHYDCEFQPLQITSGGIWIAPCKRMFLESRSRGLHFPTLLSHLICVIFQLCHIQIIVFWTLFICEVSIWQLFSPSPSSFYSFSFFLVLFLFFFFFIWKVEHDILIKQLIYFCLFILLVNKKIWKTLKWAKKMPRSLV